MSRGKSGCFLIRGLTTMLLGVLLGTVSAAAGETPQTPKTSNNRIVVGAESGYPPYSFLDEQGEPTGFNVELMQAIADVMGMDVEIRIDTWAGTRKALENDEIDAVSGMYFSEERHKLVDFSSPFTIIHHTAFARANSPGISSEESLRGKQLIVMRGDIMHDYVLAKQLCDEPVLVDTLAESLQLLASGKHDYALVAKLPGLYRARELQLDNIRAVGPLIRPSRWPGTEKNALASVVTITYPSPSTSKCCWKPWHDIQRTRPARKSLSVP